MRSLLTMLDTVAIFLAILLGVAIVFAVRAYRSKPRNITLKKGRPDA